MQEKMHLGYISQIVGSHVGGWRMPGANTQTENLEKLARTVQTAERAKLDFVFFADTLISGAGVVPDSVVRFEPLTLLGALSALTERIGLVATVSTTFSEPYNVARALASLDHISQGRIGWNVVTSGLKPEAAANFSNKQVAHSERYDIAEEYLKIAKGLWDSWEDDAVVADPISGVYIDTSKMHPLNHVGKHFSVRGPLNASRPPQGHPVIFEAGASDRGIELAGAGADAVFANQSNQDGAIALSKKLRDSAEAAGRPRDAVKVMLGVSIIVGETEQEAYEIMAQLGTMVDPVTSMRLLSERLGADMNQYDLDGPVPKLPHSTISIGHQRELQSLAQRRNMTIRQLRDYVAISSGHRALIGTPEQVADDLESWFKSGACDGFAITLPYVPQPLEKFADRVIPILVERGIFRAEYEGKTLRSHLGLRRPEHFARA